ncbi:MAG TPA: hypothetical protein VNH18_18030 [Bryobacteraceae bacterium]|nr:hypothetical protein [Bryobacteraceae bacterium]
MKRTLTFPAFAFLLQVSPPLNPANRHAVYHAMGLNFHLKAGGKAVDTGS